MPLEALAVLLFLLFAAAPVVLAALAVVAYIRSNRIVEILDRLDRLERRLDRLNAPGPVVSIPVAVAAPVAHETVPNVPVAEEVLPVESVATHEPWRPSAEPVPAPPLRPPQTASAPVPEPPLRLPQERPWQAGAVGLEWWIGNRIGWLAVVVFVFAAAFFLKYAFDNNWINEWGRVCIGLATGAALCVGGFGFHRRSGYVLRDVCTAAGVATLYLSAYATFGFFHPELLTPDHGGDCLTTAIALATALAVAYDSAPIALLTLTGGLLTPLLLASPVDQYLSLFLYLSCLAGAEVGVTLWRPWPAVRTAALLGVEGLYWLWFSAQYQPEKRPAALLFIAVIYALFFGHALLTARGRRAAGEDLALVVLNPALFFVAAYFLLGADYHLWRGALALGVALACTGGAAFVVRWRMDDPPLRFLWIAVGLVFLAIAVPLQIDLMEIGLVWIAPCWALMGLALWWYGLRVVRVASRSYRAFGVVLLAGALIRLLTAEEFFVAPGRFVPVLNAYTAAGALTAACLFGAAFVARRYARRLEEGDRGVRYGAGLLCAALLWLLLSREIYDFCTHVLYPGADPWGSAQGQRAAQTAFPVAWAAMGLALWFLGLRGASRPYRVFGAVLLIAALLRLLTADAFFVGGGEPFIPLGNAYTIAGVLTAAGLFGSAFLARRHAGKLEAGDQAVRYGAGFIGIALICLLVSREVYGFCTEFLYPAAGLGPSPGERLAQTALAAAWAVMGLALWYFGLRGASRPYRAFGALLLVGALLRLLTAEDYFVREGPFVPLFNNYAIAGALTAAAFLGAAFAARRYAGRLEEADVVVRYGAGLIGVALIWLLLSREVYDFCTLVLNPHAAPTEGPWPGPGERLAQTALSVTWTAYAALLLWAGFTLNHALTRWAALTVFAVTVAKVFLYDLSGLDGLLRILAFLVLSLVLAAAAWGYQKFQAYLHVGPNGEVAK
jgi:uncharacterized membrane protein